MRISSRDQGCEASQSSSIQAQSEPNPSWRCSVEFLGSLSDQLRLLFGFDQFRPGQTEVISQVMAGKSLLALMPTGSGKSLCFQFPSKAQAQGAVLVVSPLIALMEEQSHKARSFGIAATFINSALGKADREKRQRQIQDGHFQLIFVTPERLRKEDFLDCVKDARLFLLAVDEAHCISQWGHDFRPDYARIGEFRQRLGNPPVLAVTATATLDVQKDICRSLGIAADAVVDTGLFRPNLAIAVHDVYGLPNKVDQLLKLMTPGVAESEGEVGARIVYFSLIQTLKRTAQDLRSRGVEFLTYHGDLPAGERRKQQKMFIEHPSPLMLATPAFGLGIDKENVRQVVHFETPGSLESYFQEIGRAGRDGQAARCDFLYDEDDISIQMEFIKWSHPDEEFVRKVFQLVAGNSLQLQQEGFDYLREKMVFKTKRDFRVEAAVAILERWGCLQKIDEASLRFPYLAFEEPRVEHFRTENSPELQKLQHQKLLALVRWLNQDQSCRMRLIYEYFTAKEHNDCGRCDVCVGRLG